MKTIKTNKILLLVLLSTLFLSCSENYDDNVFLEPDIEPTIKSIGYHFKQYYEKPVVINRSTNDDDIGGYSYSGGEITLGRVIFQGRYINNEVIDTLTIDLTSFNHCCGMRLIRLFAPGSQPTFVEGKYATINYLNIIGLDENPDLKIIGEGAYGKVQIINSNVSVDKLNSISKNMFEKIDYKRKEWKWDYRMDVAGDDYTYANLLNRPTGYIGYPRWDRRGIKIEIMNVTEIYR